MVKTKKFSLNRAFSFRYNEKNKTLFVGYNPPHAKKIGDSSGLLRDLVDIFKRPITLGRATFELARKHSLYDVTTAIEMAIEHHFITLSLNRRRGRYDRHELYAGLCGLQDRHEKVLKGRSIAIVGVGGIGSNCAILAASAGISNIILIDADKVESTNLTRTTLFSESDVGKYKVLCAAKNIARLRKNVKIKSHTKPFNKDNLEFYLKALSSVDVMILSADKAEVHLTALKVSNRLRIPYINAGYVETKGVVGPFIIPGVTACYECERLHKKGVSLALPELNPSLQAASFGPLNYIVSGLAVSEVMKFFWGLSPALQGNRWIFDSIGLGVVTEKIKIHKECEYCNVFNEK